VRLLLDTHALVWALSDVRKLPRAAVAAIRDPENDVLVSAASIWELAIKCALGRIDVDFAETVAAVDATGFDELPIRIAHTVRLRTLPPEHRDPFDRMLAAQALADGLVLVSRDPVFAAYRVPILWRR